jgi:tripartite-type tricarboxylate transporter receptor subunit TctC
MFAQKVGEALGQNIIVDNKPGASGTLAADTAAKSPADGLTLLASSPTVMIVAPHLYKSLPFHPGKDFDPVVLLGGGPLVLVVHADTPARTVQDLVALGKAKPGQIAFGSGGLGTASHLSSAMFAHQAGVQLLHSPYKGEGQAINDLLGGQVQMMLTAYNLVEPHVKSGRLRLLGVSSKTRMAALPQAPTLDESGLRGYESLGWIGIYAPAKTPMAVRERIAAEWRKARATPEIASKFDSTGMGYIPSGTPEEFAAFQLAETTRWAKVIKDANIQPE